MELTFVIKMSGMVSLLAKLCLVWWRWVQFPTELTVRAWTLTP